MKKWTMTFAAMGLVSFLAIPVSAQEIIQTVPQQVAMSQPSNMTTQAARSGLFSRLRNRRAPMTNQQPTVMQTQAPPMATAQTQTQNPSKIQQASALEPAPLSQAQAQAQPQPMTTTPMASADNNARQGLLARMRSRLGR